MVSSIKSFVAMLPFLMLSGLAANFYDQIQVSWGDGRGQISDNGNLVTLNLDEYSGSGFQTNTQYLFAKIDMNIKLVHGNSAGTVTTYYLSSQGNAHDEIDFEFLGNLSGDPYILHTNIFTQGKGNREQQFYLWFDPTADYHTYTILWNPQHIVLLVDNLPIREFKNMLSQGIPYPTSQPMRMYSSLWNADQWATRGGQVKTDWSLAPFTASYRNLTIETCLTCGTNSSPYSLSSQELGDVDLGRISWAKKNYMIYNYCTDSARFPKGFPPECTS